MSETHTTQKVNLDALEAALAKKSEKPWGWADCVSACVENMPALIAELRESRKRNNDKTPQQKGGHTMKQWTREHDAVIAEKVEGLKITTERFSAGVDGRTTTWNRYFYNNPDWGMIEIPSYNEPKHFFRALEKWRKESTNRYWVIESSYGADGEMACYLINTKEGIRVNEYGKDAPAWALYKAVVNEV